MCDFVFCFGELMACEQRHTCEMVGKGFWVISRCIILQVWWQLLLLYGSPFQQEIKAALPSLSQHWLYILLPGVAFLVFSCKARCVFRSQSETSNPSLRMSAPMEVKAGLGGWSHAVPWWNKGLLTDWNVLLTRWRCNWTWNELRYHDSSERYCH